MKPFLVRVGRKTVSTSGSRSAFAWAICSSYSKSVAARSPRTMTRAFFCLQNWMSRPSKASTVTLGRCAETLATRSRRSSTVKRGLRVGCRPMPTMTSLKSADARSMRSRWPSVGGSKLPA